MTTEQIQVEKKNALLASGLSVIQFSYRVGDYSVLLESQISSEVVDAQSISDVPFSPDWCLGLASTRGELYPVMDMHKIVLDKTPPEEIKLLLIKHPEFSPILLACDGFASQQNVPEKTHDKQDDEGLPAWISHSLTHNNETLLVADHSRLLRYVQRISIQHPS